MATRKSQRIVIWVISIVMLVGTVGGFIAMMVAPGNEAKEKAALESAQAEWEAAQQAQANDLSEKYYEMFTQYENRVGVFDAAAVSELKTEDLAAGDGAEIKGESGGR